MDEIKKSPQEDYDYGQLWKYLTASRKSVENYHEQYPDLSFEHQAPELYVMNHAKEVFAEYTKEWHEKTQYLDYAEQGIQIGSVPYYKDRTELKRWYDHLEKANREFKELLENTLKVHETYVRSYLLRISKLTAKHTAGRLQELRRRLDWVDTQYEYYANFHVRQIKAFKIAADKEWTFTNNDKTEDIPPLPGVYILFHNGEPVYVGSSSNLNQRINGHNIVQKYHCKNELDQIECVYAVILEDQAEIESALIRMLQPKYNQKGKE